MPRIVKCMLALAFVRINYAPTGLVDSIKDASIPTGGGQNARYPTVCTPVLTCTRQRKIVLHASCVFGVAPLDISYLQLGRGVQFWDGGSWVFCFGSGAASKILWTKTGHGTYLGLILIHTKLEKKY